MLVIDAQYGLYHVSLEAIMEYERESSTSRQIAQKALAATVLLVMKDDNNQFKGLAAGSSCNQTE